MENSSTQNVLVVEDEQDAGRSVVARARAVASLMIERHFDAALSSGTQHLLAAVRAHDQPGILAYKTLIEEVQATRLRWRRARQC